MLNWLRSIDLVPILSSALVLVLLLWFLAANPDYETYSAVYKNPFQYIFGWLSPEGWTALFTGVLTVSTILLWIETRRMASGGEEHAVKMERSIGEAAKAADAMKNVASGMGLAAKAMKDVAYQAELSNIENKENTKTQFKQMRQYIDAANAAVTEAKRGADASAEAVTVAREIGEAQVRAYLSCEDSRFQIGNDTIQVWPLLKNTGQSPASKIEVEGSLSVWEGLGLAKTQRFEAEYAPTNASPIPAGKSDTASFLFLGIDLKIPEGFLRIKGIHCSVQGYVAWTDVFGKQQGMNFALTQMELSDGEDRNGFFLREGIMSARNRTPMTDAEWAEMIAEDEADD